VKKFIRWIAFVLRFEIATGLRITIGVNTEEYEHRRKKIDIYVNKNIFDINIERKQ